MLYLLLYAIFVLLLAGLALLVIFNFLRFRFKGDRSMQIVILFTIAFVLLVLAALILIDPSSFGSNPPKSNTSSFSTF
jgi:hypothetical protein